MNANHPAYFIQPALAPSIPLVLDSPHSGFSFPDDFRPAAPVEAVRTGWDGYLDELWSSATALGAPLLCARFPRTYIDANRAADDIDPALMATPWPHPSQPSDYSRRGQGLIRRFALPGIPMYDRALSVAEVENRLHHYYLPYRQALRQLIDAALQAHRQVWHLDLHSMKSTGNAMNEDAGQARPDFVISDRLGSSADPRATQWIADQFSAMGYRTLVNTPYRGGDIVRTYGAPAQGCHSIQIEINRALYMQESSGEKSANYPRLKADIDRFLVHFAAVIGDPAGAFPA
ncbi:N-formylglutamate amidohydrolase [Herbaspirillum sp. NPDC087042]|uniref:N-formylglutamate amidohydrolase n=1 Tax=Herbaspirillum sp. NPDC087042 TaxID=3364004 RepID=UPI00382113C3